MGHTLNLSIYTISVKKTGSKKDEFTNFGDFLKDVVSVDADLQGNERKLQRFSNFSTEIENWFNNGFIIDNKNTKAIANHRIEFDINEDLIEGMLLGGPTGIEQEVYDVTNSSRLEETIEPNQVTSLRYYFCIWIPQNAPVGLLFIQAYTVASINSLFKDVLRGFFQSKNYSFRRINKHVPDNLREEFLNSARVQKIVVEKNKLNQSARELISPYLIDKEEIGLRLEVRNIKGFKFSDLLTGHRRRKIWNFDIEELGIKDDEYEVKVFYEDEKGYKSHASSSNLEDILPNIILPDNLKEIGQEYPKFEFISNYVKTLLPDLKREQGLNV